MYLYTWVLYISLSFLCVLLSRKMIDRKYAIGLKGNALNDTYIAAVFFFVLVFFAVFRTVLPDGTGGSDAYGYLQWFDNAPSIDEFFRYFKFNELLKDREPVFLLLNSIIKGISSSHRFYFLITYSIVVAGFIYFVYNLFRKDSYFFFLILLIPCYIHSFNVMRSWISVSICMFAFVQIIRRNWLKSIVLVAVAAMFHYMAMCFFFVIIASLVEERMKHLITGFRLIIVGVGMNFLTFVLKNSIQTFIMTTKYSYYENLFDGEVSLLGYTPPIMICLIGMMLYDHYKHNNIMSKCIVAVFVNFSLAYATIFLFAWRINDFFALIRIVILSEFCVFLYKKGSVSIMNIFVYLFAIIVFFQQFFRMRASSHVFPYIIDLL